MEYDANNEAEVVLMVDANKWPKTVEQAVDQLTSTMSEEDKKTLGNTPEKDLINYHFGLGMYIRN